MDSIWTQFCDSAASRIGDLLESRIRAFLSRFVKNEIHIVFSEAEAADFLKVSASTLAAWRKAKLIAHTRYPQAHNDRLSGIYTYDIADLLNFRDKYKLNGRGDERFRIAPAVSLAGVEIEILRKAA